MKRAATTLFLLFTFNVGSSAFAAFSDSSRTMQDSIASITKQATLSVQSNIVGVKVFLDTLLLGDVPLRDVSVEAGMHIIRFVHPDMKSWLVPAIVETISLAPSGHIDRTVNFPFVYYITSDPYSAEVHHSDSVIGRTPFLFTTFSSREVITLTKEGYEDVALPLPPDGGAVHAAMQSRLAGRISAVFNGEQPKSLTPIYFTSGAAIAGGVVAAYFKIKADGHYNDYRISGDQGTLEQVRRFDTISGVALVTSEVSLLLLSYFLLSR